MKKQHLTKDGLKWLYIDIANTFGLDKLTHEAQLDWVDKNINILESLEDEAESKYEFRNAVAVLREHQKGLPVAHNMYIDCSNQALQLYAVLTADYDTAYACNLSSGSVRTDAYGALAIYLNELLFTDIFNRSNCKKAFMTTLYGKKNGESEILSEMHLTLTKLTNIIINENNEELILSNQENWFADAFYEAMVKLAPKAMLAMEMIQALNDEKIDTYYWTMPDGFNVKYDVKREVQYEGHRISSQGIEFSFSAETSVYGGTKYNAGMAPNLIHSVDGYVARLMIERMDDKFITTIHDAFGSHPNDVELMRNNYADIMVELMNSNLLEDLMSQIANGRIYNTVEKTFDLTEEHIRNSVYAIS